jgi:hemolysin III
MMPIVVGGVLYSVGAAINLAHWPAIWPGIFGSHALFHLFVIGGSLAHYWFILQVVAPSDRSILAGHPTGLLRGPGG